MSIHVRGISKSFGSFKALDRVSLDVPEGTLLALLGPSGSGKTTLLRIIAGLEFADEGVIEEDGEDITERHARDREVGFVFQHYALFRHMSVFENIAFGLRVRKAPQAEVNAKVEELLRLVRLDGLGGRKPSQLSGGQRQRVALARALAIRPKILLLDEPFGALDAKVRVELRQWLRRLHDEIGMTSVFVTHDQEEAFELADTVVVMNHGKIEQQGSPDDVFDHPATPFVMDFLGNVNVYHGRVENGRAFWHGIPIDYPDYPHAQAREARVYLRPHELELSPPAAVPNRLGTSLPASILRVSRSGPITRVTCKPHGSEQEVQVDLPTEVAHRLQVTLEPGSHVAITPRKARVFVPDPEYVI
ncbi:MAG: sulfate/molybdate ABC transporter ATP-binding protein [Planctomycetes bacterium]|nr:sulfate/molybdate ABC transporter ATP-binding protein [Planctomycetota bacterium]